MAGTVHDYDFADPEHRFENEDADAEHDATFLPSLCRILPVRFSLSSLRTER